MTAASSAKTNGVFFKFLPYYRNKLKILRPQMIMMGIFALLSYPFAGLIFNLQIDAEIRINQLMLSSQGSSVIESERARGRLEALNSLAIMSAVIAVICLVGMFVFTFVSTHRAFRRLYNKTAVDMDYALPVSGNTRFFADIAAIFTTCILPHLISILIGLPFAYSFASKTRVLHPNYPAAFVNAFNTVAVQSMFAGLFSCIMLIGLSLLVMSCCGKRAEAAIFPIMINLAIPIIQALAIVITNQNVYGAYYGTSNLTSVCATSPVGMAVKSFYDGIMFAFSIDIGNVPDGLTLPLFSAKNLIPAILLTLAFFAGAYFLLKFRRNERVGTPYVYKAMSVVLPGIVILAMSLPMWNMVYAPFSFNAYQSYNKNGSASWLIGLLISTFIVYVIMELISGKAFRRFWLSAVKWAGTTAVCAGITAVFAFSNGFGTANYVPEANDVRIASISLSYVNYYESGQAEDYGRFIINNTDEQNVIEMITEVHKRVPKYKTYTEKNGNLVLGYQMKNGEYVHRSYEITTDEFDSYMEFLVTPETWYETMCGNTVNEKLTDERARSVYYLKDENEVNLIPKDNSGYFLRNILSEVRKDAEGMNYEKYRLIDYNDCVSVMFYYDEGTVGIEVYPFMEHTIRYLSEHFEANFAEANFAYSVQQ